LSSFLLTVSPLMGCCGAVPRNETALPTALAGLAFGKTLAFPAQLFARRNNLRDGH
jgi:hypothetical protein